jgi:hypothetical protein
VWIKAVAGAVPSSWRGVTSGVSEVGMRYRLALYLDKARLVRPRGVSAGGAEVRVSGAGFRRRGLTRVGLLSMSWRLGLFLGSSS